MALMVLRASYLTLATVDWSAKLKKITVKAEVEEKDVTTFASGGWVEVKGGLFKAGLDLTWLNDYADNNLDEVMWGHFLTGEPIAWLAKASNAAVSASNPSYGGNVLVSKWDPISGSVGDVAGHDVSWPTSGAVTRAVA